MLIITDHVIKTNTCILPKKYITTNTYYNHLNNICCKHYKWFKIIFQVRNYPTEYKLNKHGNTEKPHQNVYS